MPRKKKGLNKKDEMPRKKKALYAKDVSFVPFILTEWQTVAKAFADYDSPELIFEAIQVITTWKLRFNSSFIPAAIQASEVLIQARLNDLAVNGTDLPGWIQESNNGYVIGLAITRFINFVNELGQKNKNEGTIRESVEEFGIPEWIVDLRHEAVHGIKYPSLTLLRDALQFCWNWLRDNYWNESPRTTFGTKFFQKISQTKVDSFKMLFSRYRSRTRKVMKKNLNNTKFMADFEKYFKRHFDIYNDKLFEYLFNDTHFLVDDNGLKHWEWNLEENIYPPLLAQQMWRPLFTLIKKCSAMSVFLNCLCAKIRQTCHDYKTKKQLLCWLRFLMDNGFTDSFTSCDWYKILIGYLNGDTLGEEQNLMNSIIDKASPSLTDHQNNLLKLLLNIKSHSWDPKEMDLILKEPLKDIPMEATANVAETTWELAKASYSWADCALGLLPYQSADTLDLRFSSMKADRDRIDSSDEIVLDDNEIYQKSDICESNAEEIWINE